MGTNIIKINKYLEKFNNIEIRVEKVHDEEKGISFYFTYAFINKINNQTELNENISNDVEKYLKHHFEVYLEGGDTFKEESGKTHVFTMERDEFGNPEYYDDADIFKEATEQLKSSPFILDYSKEGYGDITFKSDGTNIMISFIVPPDVEY